MAHTWRAVAVAAATVLGGAGASAAQPPLGPSGPASSYRPGLNPSGIPAYSPYLNLLRPGNPAFMNYYGLVRPELDFRAAVRGLQQQVTANRQTIGNLE